MIDEESIKKTKTLRIAHEHIKCISFFVLLHGTAALSEKLANLLSVGLGRSAGCFWFEDLEKLFLDAFASCGARAPRAFRLTIPGVDDCPEECTVAKCYQDSSILNGM
jgi:hypothetical protein